MKRRTKLWFIPGILQYLQTACLVKSGCLEPRIRNGSRLTTCLHICAETVLRLCGLPNRDLEFAGFIPDCSVNAKHLSLVAVAPLIERPHEPDIHLRAETVKGIEEALAAK